MNAVRHPAAATTRPQRRDWTAPLVLAALLPVAMVAATAIGALAIPVADVVGIALDAIGGPAYAGNPTFAAVWTSIRLPRVMTAVVVGVALAVAGAAMQGVFRNPLADPGLVGVSSGAALGAALAIVLGAGAVELGGVSLVGDALTSAAAFVGGTLATLLALQLATRGGRTDIATLLLAGVAVNALAGGGLGWLSFVADDARLRALTMWLLGTVGTSSWSSIAIITVCAMPLLGWATHHARAYDALQLGEAQAWSMGVDVVRLQRVTVLLAALAVAGTVSFCGIVGFVGLVAPHLARLLCGARHRVVLPTAALLGALLVLGADTVGRVAVAPAELPLGVVLSLIGAPALVWLLHRQQQRRGA